jgi:hypothetical protein
VLGLAAARVFEMRADVFWAWTAEGRAAVHERARVHRLPNGLGVDVDLRIPKPRQGSFFPALLQPRRRIDRALWAIVMEAYVHGVSTRKVNDLVAALASTPASARARVSRICTELEAFLGIGRLKGQELLQQAAAVGVLDRIAAYLADREVSSQRIRQDRSSTDPSDRLRPGPGT